MSKLRIGTKRVLEVTNRYPGIRSSKWPSRQYECDQYQYIGDVVLDGGGIRWHYLKRDDNKPVRRTGEIIVVRLVDKLPENPAHLWEEITDGS